MLALSIGASMAIADHDKTAKYNTETRILLVPQASINGSTQTFSVELQNIAPRKGDYLFQVMSSHGNAPITPSLNVTNSTDQAFGETSTLGAQPAGTNWATSGNQFRSQWCGDRYLTEATENKEADWGHWKKFPNLLTKGEFLDYTKKMGSMGYVCGDVYTQYWTTDGNGDRHVCNFDLTFWRWQCDDWTVNKDTNTKHAAIVWCVSPNECKSPGDYKKYGGVVGSALDSKHQINKMNPRP